MPGHLDLAVTHNQIPAGLEPGSTQPDTTCSVSQPDSIVPSRHNTTTPSKSHSDESSLCLQHLPPEIWQDISLEFSPDDLQALTLTCKAARRFIVSTSTTSLFITQFSMASLQPSQVALHSDLQAIQSLTINLKGPLLPRTLPFFQCLQDSSSSLLSGLTSLKLLLNHRLPAPLVSSLNQLLTSCHSLARLELCASKIPTRADPGDKALVTLVLQESHPGAGLPGISGIFAPGGSEELILNTRHAALIKTPQVCSLLANPTLRSHLKSLDFASDRDTPLLPEKAFTALDRLDLSRLQSLSLYPAPKPLPFSLPHLTQLTLLSAAFTFQPTAERMLKHVPQLTNLQEIKLGFMLLGVQEGTPAMKVNDRWSTLQALTKLDLDNIFLPATCGVWKLRSLTELLLDFCTIEVQQGPTLPPPQATTSTSSAPPAATQATHPSAPPLPHATCGLHSLPALQSLQLSDCIFRAPLATIPDDLYASHPLPSRTPPAPQYPPSLTSLSISFSPYHQAPMPSNILSHTLSLSQLKRLTLSEAGQANSWMSSHEIALRWKSQQQIITSTAEIESLEHLEISFVLRGHPTLPPPSFERLSRLTCLSFAPFMWQSHLEFPESLPHLQQLNLTRWQSYLPPQLLAPTLTALQVTGPCLSGYLQCAHALEACTALQVLHLDVEGIWLDFRSTTEPTPGIKSVLPQLTSLRCLKLTSLPSWPPGAPHTLHGLSFSRLVLLTSLSLSSPVVAQRSTALDLHCIPGRLKSLTLVGFDDLPPYLPPSLTCLQVLLKMHPIALPPSIASCTALEQVVIEAADIGISGTSHLAALSNLNQLVLTGVKDKSISELDSLSMLTQLRMHALPGHRVVGHLPTLQKSLAPECLSLGEGVTLTRGGHDADSEGGSSLRGVWQKWFGCLLPSKQRH